MAKTPKELAFLRDLYIADQWTSRFTDLIDKHVDFERCDNLLYINAGTGNHAFALRDKIGSDTAMFATCEDEDTLKIAREKGAVVSSDIDFSMIRFDDAAFDVVLADASFVRPNELADFLDEATRVAEVGGTVAALTVSSGSFGEIFSLLWEVLFNQDLGDHGAAAERMISEIPTVSVLEGMARKAGLVNIKSHTANEVFEFENGAEFVSSPLIEDFLLPAWLDSLSEEDKKRVTDELVRLVDDEDGTLSFRFSVKATLVSGEKG